MTQKEFLIKYVKIYNFIGQLLSTSGHLPLITSYICELYKTLELYRLRATGLPQYAIQKCIACVSKDENKVKNCLYATETVVHNSSLLPAESWTVTTFFYGDSSYLRALKFYRFEALPLNSVILCGDTLFNIRNSVKSDQFKACHWRAPVQFSIQVVDNFCHPEASKVVISFLKSCLTTWKIDSARRALTTFFKTPRFMRQGDVVSVDLGGCSEELKMNDPLRFRVVSIEKDESKDGDVPASDRVLAVTSSTAVYEVDSCQGFFPPSPLRMIDPSDTRTTSPCVPPGMESYFEAALECVRPFLYAGHPDLQPIFIISGPSGCGKTFLLSRLSDFLGLAFLSVDSYDLVANVQSHILAASKGLAKLAVESAPCILELFNAEVLSSESDGVDSDQVFSILSRTLSSLDTKYPVVVFMTTSNVGAFKHNFVTFALQQLSIGEPSEDKKNELLSWLGLKNNISLDVAGKEFLKTHTSSFLLGDLERLICGSSKPKEDQGCVYVCSMEDLKQGLESMNRSKSDKVANSEWQDVGGVEEIKREVLTSLLTNKLMPSVRRTGILLHGPPGTGKTLLARTVASQCGRSFVSVKGPELLNMYVGQSESNVRQVFQRAKEAAPCIMFFDELDSLAPNRGNKSDAGGVMDRVVSQLLAEIDSLENEDVFILGATNRPDLLDPALLRPGRFDKMIYVGPCKDDDAKIKVLEALTRKFKMDAPLDDVVSCIPGSVTGANLYALCSEAWMRAARELIVSQNCDPGVEVIVGLDHFKAAAREVFNAQTP